MESLSLIDRQTALHILEKEVKGGRDVIAHHYFDIDAYEIFSIINNDMDSLKDAIHFFKGILADK